MRTGITTFSWQSVGPVSESRAFTCGYCGNAIASNQGYLGQNNQRGEDKEFIYICHRCFRPTYFALDSVGQMPGPLFGRTVEHIPIREVRDLYDESRRCLAVNAFTASVLCSRKLLMNVAVSKGANAGETFASYVSYLAEKGYIPPDGKEWVDHVRTKGNEANHEIVLMSRSDAEELITFMEMLLKFVYEFPAAMRSKAATGNASQPTESG